MTSLPADIETAIAPYPDAARTAFLAVRKIVFQAAGDNPAVGPLTEALKWGEPAYLTSATGSGTTLRIAWKAATPRSIAILFNCRTTLVETLRSIYPETFIYQGNRALLVSLDAPLPVDALDHCARLAQTYHLRDRKILKSA